MNESLILSIYLKLKLDFISLSIFKSLRNYNKSLLKRFIIYYLLLIINVASYKKDIYLILITLLNIYNNILRKL